MKILPCSRCSDGKARMASGQPYWIQRYPGAQYRCAACGKAHRITPAEFARLPPAARADLEQGGALDSMARDLVGSDPADMELAKQGIVAGIQPDKIRASSRPIDQTRTEK